MGAKVVIVGGGVYVAKLGELLARTVRAEGLELVLAARRLPRLRAIADHTRLRVVKWRPSWRVEVAPSAAEALPGADLVLLLLRVGGLRARAWDERFPRRFGLIGDEGLSAGGLANAWRTFPVLRELARTIASTSPRARVLNLVAPLAPTTRLLLEAGLDAFGVCELPLITEERLRRASRAGPAARLAYGGLNHLGWFWPRDLAGETCLIDARDAGLIRPETLDAFGAAPLHYYEDVFGDEAREAASAEATGRAEALASLSERALRRFVEHPGAEVAALDERPTPWFDRALVPIVDALLGGPAHLGYANVANRGIVGELSAESVVEAPAVIDERGVHPRSTDPLPARVAEFLGAVDRADGLGYRAAIERDPDLLTRAMRELPLGIAPPAAQELARLARRPIEPAPGAQGGPR